MRIAVSGTHVTGKSTLVNVLGTRLSHHTTLPEPYDILEERGYAFAHPPTIEDFVMQLKLSLATLRRRSPNMIFDRCPLDFLGYIYASPGADRFDLDPWRGPIEHAMKSLDLVVFLHAEPEHDPELPAEEAAFRLAVDEALRDIIEGDEFGLCEGVEILALGGPWDGRAETVLAHATMLAEATGNPERGTLPPS